MQEGAPFRSVRVQALCSARVQAEIEERLWASQNADGGIWTNYSAAGTFPAFAKKTNEIGPLTLLAYDHSIWPAPE